jgi:hypothetical protein
MIRLRMSDLRTASVVLWLAVASSGVGALAQSPTASRPAESRAASRPCLVPPEELTVPATVVRDVKLPRWSWPAKDAFARRSTGPLSCVRFWTARAEVTAEGAPSARVHRIVLRNHVDWEGNPRAYVVTGRLESAEVASSNVGARLDQLSGDPLPPADRDLPKTAVFNGYRIQAVVSQITSAPCVAPSSDHAALWGYPATLLDDSRGDPELPEGQCSMDTEPMRAAVRFSKKASDEGALGRFLRLRLRVVANDFERMMMSNYGDAALSPEPSALRAAPVRLAPFFAGLCLFFESPAPRPVEVPAQRLGRAIADLGLKAELEPWLRGVVEDDAVDPLNRLRAVQVLYDLLAHSDAESPLNRNTSRTRTREEVLPKVANLKIPEPGRMWLGIP